MENKNIKYESKQIMQFYSSNRQRWEELYPSEQWVFSRVSTSVSGGMGNVLDVGCACGGLGKALSEKLALCSYTGVDINNDAIEWAKQELHLPIPTRLIAGDIMDLDLDQQYDTVVSLSCADWNIETLSIIKTCWERVKPGGFLIISLRLTPENGVNDISQSYQYINFSADEVNPEVANYVVLNFMDALGIMKNMQPAPESVGAYGYWGQPSKTAVTKFDKLVFAVFYIKKGVQTTSTDDIQTEFYLPAGIYYRS